MKRRDAERLKRARRSKRRGHRLPVWTPFERAQYMNNGMTGERDVETSEEIWVNSRFQVHVTRNVETGFDFEVIWLSIKHRDLSARHDWREFQRIKNELVGPEREAFEVYPAESRLVDEADQFHLWVLPEGLQIPLGWTEGRLVSEGPPPLGSQRPFEVKPPELVDATE